MPSKIWTNKRQNLHDNGTQRKSNALLQRRRKNKGIKMIIALMLEAMVSDCIIEHSNRNHPHPKHYLPYVSEIIVAINQIFSKKKKN